MATERQIIGEYVACTEPVPVRPAAGGSPPVDLPEEFGGRDGPEPTRFGDWEKNGRCIDF